MSSPCPGADATLGGSVSDKDGKPLAGATVNLTVDGASVGSPVSGSDGSYTLSFKAPAAEGNHPVTATATIDGQAGPTVNASLKVVSCAAAPPAPSRPDLPRTGSSDSTMTMVKIGVALVAFGAALVAFAQKRRRRGAALA